MEVILDCRRFTDRDAAHTCLREQFGFPDYYGRNLDALYDCLMELSNCRILLQEPAALTALEDYGSALLETLNDAVRDNPGLELYVGNAL